MHEIRIAEELVKIVVAVAQREGFSRVSQINLQFGQMIQIVPDIFRFAFSEAIKNTVAENSAVDIEILPIQLRCNSCAKEFNIYKAAFVCEYCSSTNIDIIHGKEMLIKSIEGD